MSFVSRVIVLDIISYIRFETTSKYPCGPLNKNLKIGIIIIFHELFIIPDIAFKLNTKFNFARYLLIFHRIPLKDHNTNKPKTIWQFSFSIIIHLTQLYEIDKFIK